MDCPACKNPMITLELNDVEIDHCQQCSGIWLDAGELELLLAYKAESENLLKSFKADDSCNEEKRKCPICLKKMEKIAVSKAVPPQIIDRCSKGHGLWFDQNELPNILKTAKLDKDNKIVLLLKEIFPSS